MQKISGNTVCWLLWILAFSSHAMAANKDESNVQNIYSKILYFDSLDIKDSLSHYINLGYSECNKYDINSINSIDSREVELNIAEIYYYYGGLNYVSNEVFESINGYEKAATYFKKYGIKTKYSDCIFNLATNFSKVDQAPRSLELMHEATSIFIDLKDNVNSKRTKQMLNGMSTNKS